MAFVTQEVHVVGNKIGITQMPSDFRYREVIAKGKPEHGRFDDFRIRHPKMATGRRAKIFSPFDALKGFNEAVASKNVIYTERKILSEEEQKKLTESFRSSKSSHTTAGLRKKIMCRSK